ncbi:hypothetical protein [Geopseudomonas aromaticivorans]
MTHPASLDVSIAEIGLTLEAFQPGAGLDLPTPLGAVLIPVDHQGMPSGDRYQVHSRDEFGYLIGINLTTLTIFSEKEQSLRTRCITLFPGNGETYPHKDLSEALEAARQGHPLFSLPRTDT